MRSPARSRRSREGGNLAEMVDHPLKHIRRSCEGGNLAEMVDHPLKDIRRSCEGGNLARVEPRFLLSQ